MPLNSRLTAATPLLYLTYQLFNRLAKYKMPVDRLSATFSALADPTRRAILARLALGETSVGELAEPFDISGPAVSKHLKVLEDAGLITRGREAQWRPCKLEPASLKPVDEWLEDYRRLWEQRLDRLEAYLEELKAKAAPDKSRKGKQGTEKKNGRNK
jgi:DNA-binding transcriptional ArsR family regulator